MAKAKAAKAAAKTPAFTPDAELLAQINSGAVTTGPVDEVQPYADAGFVKITQVTDGIAVFEPVKAEAEAEAEAPAPAAEAAESDGFEIDAIEGPAPAITRGPGIVRKSIYPFDKLPAPERDANGNVIKTYSFHVAKTAERPDPANSMGSVVTNANHRYGKQTGQFRTRTIKGKTVSTPIYEYERKFTVRKVGPDDIKGEGARVLRIL